MSHFGITSYGYQNSVRPATVHAKCERGQHYLNYTALPPLVDKDAPLRSIVPINQISAYGSGHQRSYEEQERLRTKHTRNPRGPTDIYHYPLSEGHKWGWFSRHEPLKQTLPWSNVKRVPAIHSPMTRFVDIMKLTDKTFTLF